jgi:hypothetical protein
LRRQIFKWRLADSAAPSVVQIHSTSVLAWLNGENERRADVVGIFSTEDAITRLVGAIRMGPSEGRADTKRYDRRIVRCSGTRPQRLETLVLPSRRRSTALYR